MSTTLITVTNVRKYDVKDAYNFHIEKGEFIVIQGYNGCGKTTLIRLLLGFIKPDSGSINMKKIKIGYLPETLSLPFFMRGDLFLKLHEHMKKCEIKPALLHLFQVPLFRYVHQLSKGNKQKLSIMATLVGKPELIIMDEPLSGLDDESINQFINYLHIMHEQHMTFIIVSHQPSRFENIMTRMIRL